MGFMTSPASDSLKEILARLDQRIRAVDEERWLSSRYADPERRDALIVLYAFYYELARVRVAVTDATLGRIRFQWWRDVLAELATGNVRQHDVVLALAAQVEVRRFAIEDLSGLIDGHEAAFMADDRNLEPEAALARVASHLLAGGDPLAPAFDQAVSEWAALRRGDDVTSLTALPAIPSAVRPALAHLRLRQSWSAGKKPNAFGQRISILLAVLTGRI